MVKPYTKASCRYISFLIFLSIRIVNKYNIIFSEGMIPDLIFNLNYPCRNFIYKFS